jgi:A/G-specific adenine glycosylase
MRPVKKNNKVKQEQIEYFQEMILAWYKESGRSFPWRKKGLTHYQYIIAEVLLQRTKADIIAKFFPLFIKQFPNWKSLAIAEENDIEEYLKPVGLYRQRSKRLLSLAKEMQERHGRLPKERSELESIPFMGQYIANAVELIIFNQPTPLIDVNMARVLERFFGPRKMVDIRYDLYLQELSYKIVNHHSPKDINWAVLDFAALVCTARNPKCNFCILNTKCKYYKLNFLG